MSRATRAAFVASVACLIVAVFGAWCCLGVYLATTHRDTQMFVYAAATLFALCFTVSYALGDDKK